MKILQLNVWMGKVEGNLRRFLEWNRYDVICMQEVMSSPNQNLQVARMCMDRSRIMAACGMEYSFFLPNLGMDFAGGALEIGNLILSRVPMMERKGEFVHGEYHEHFKFGEMPANNLNIQMVRLENGITIVNHHGFWRPNPLGDDESVKAFAKVGEMVRKIDGPVVMCGDLNLVHAAPAMRELDFLRDLTNENKVETTLSGLNYDGKVACDHILVSGDVEVERFMVRSEVVSDHLGLEVEISV